MSDKRLMTLMSRFTQWVNYLDSELALAEIHERGCQRVLDIIEAEGLIRYWGTATGETVTITKAKREADPAVMEAKDELQVAYAKRKLVAALHRDAERGAAFLSRELTRRLESAPQQRRGSWGTP